MLKKAITSTILFCTPNKNPSDSLINRSELAYAEIIKTRLQAILDKNLNDEKLSQEIELFLKVVWDEVKCTAISYFALPSSNLTISMFNLAFKLSKVNCDSFREEDICVDDIVFKSPFELLMPSCSLESEDDLYPNWNAFESTEFYKNNKELQQKVKNEEVILKGKYYIPRVCPDFFATHILNDNGTAILPIRLVLDKLEFDSQKKIYNPYGLDAISEAEYNRIYNHSESMQQFHKLNENLFDLIYNKTNFLSKIKNYILSLASGDAYIGTGHHKSAGKNVYSSVIDFFNYYDSMPEIEKQKIPDNLIKLIEHQRKLLVDHNVNDEQATNIETCVARWHNNLKPVVMENERLLSGIHNYDSVTISNEIDEVKSNIQKSKEQLQKELQSHMYRGVDARDLSYNLLKLLNLKISIKNKQELTLLLSGLNEKELEILFEEQPDLKNNLLSTEVTENLDDFILFIIESKMSVIQRLLTIGKLELFSHFFVDANQNILMNNINAVLSPLEHDKFRLLLDIFRSHKDFNYYSSLNFFKDFSDKQNIILDALRFDIQSEDENKRLIAFWYLCGHNKGRKLLLDKFDFFKPYINKKLLSKSPFKDPNEEMAAFWFLCVSLEGRELLFNNFNFFKPYITTELLLSSPANGPNKGKTAFWFLCSVLKGQELLFANFNFFKSQINKTLLLSGHLQDPCNGESAFWYLCSSSKGQELLLAKIGYLKQHITTELLLSSPLEGYDKGKTAFWYLCATPKGQELLLANIDCFKPHITTKLLLSSAALSLSGGESAFWYLFVTSKEKKLLFANFDSFKPHITKELLFSKPSEGPHKGVSVISYLCTITEGQTLLLLNDDYFNNIIKSKPQPSNLNKIERLKKSLETQRKIAKPLEDKKKAKLITPKEQNNLSKMYLKIHELEINIKKAQKDYKKQMSM